MLTFTAIKSHLWHWKQALTGPLLTLVLLFYQQATGKSPTWAWFVALCFGALAWQFYVDNVRVKKQFGIDGPKLSLRYIEPLGNRIVGASGFFIQVEGPKKAFDVKIISPDAVGKEHTRLEMLWSAINEPIGNNPVFVSVLCSQRRGTSSFSEMGPQLDFYRKMKATEPKDLMATVKFRDVDGNECPSRTFRIFRERDVTGNMKTFCELVKS